MTSNTSNVAVAIATPATMLQTSSSSSAHQQSVQSTKKSSDTSVKASKKSQKNASKEPSATASAKQTKAANKAAKADSKADASQETNSTKKSKAAAAAAESSSTNNGGASADTSSSKKHASKQQPFKIPRDKERKEKQQKQTAALTSSASPTASNSSKSKGAARESSSSSCASSTTNTRASTGTSTALSRLQEMEQDGVKSRNHRLFLAPPSARSSGPCWSGRRLARATRADSVADRLHDEILDYAKYTRATVDAMTVHIEQMMTHVRRCVHTLWPKSQMEPFGSYSTGIWLPSSDVDLVILGVVEIHDRMLTIKSLRQLARALDKQPWVESLVVLDTAKIPVLKLVTAESSVPIDITFESTATHSGLLARDLIKRYADEMPELYPLAVVFKQLLRERDLNDAYTGGLSSYSVVLMIVHFQLLWRYGDRCFRAAAVFASGSPLPRPADLIAEEEREKQRERELEQELEKEKAESSSSQLPANAWGKTDDKTATPTITSSFAAVVTRSKSLKRPVSEAGRTSSSCTDGGASSVSKPSTPFSYAAVAAGIAKLSTDDASAAKTNKATAPSSYAAAVAAPASQVVKTKTKTTTASSSSNASGTKKKSSDADSVSVTSSSADTEDSASLSDSKSTTSAHDDESSSSSAQPTTRSAKEPLDQDDHEPATELSLGERTMTILEFFGIIFDYRKNGLSIRDGGYIYRLADHVGASGDLCKKLPALVIEDPIHPDRNVSASSFAFSKVVAVFEDSFYALKYFRPTRFTPSALSCLLSTSGHSLHQYQLQQQQQQQQQQLDLRRLKAKARTPTSSPVKAQAQAVAAK